MLKEILWTSADGLELLFTRESSQLQFESAHQGIQFFSRQDITQQAPFQQGNTLLRSQQNPRIIKFGVHVHVIPLTGDDSSGGDYLDLDSLRILFGRALAAVNAAELKNEGTLTFNYYNGNTRTIGAHPLEGVPGIRQTPIYQHFDINFESNDPYFLNDEQSQAGIEPDDIITISNAGHVQTYPIIHITGPCNSPRITNQRTNKYILLTTYDLDADHRLEIDFRVGKKTLYEVLLADETVRVSVFQYLTDPATEFWPLLTGDNDILFESASGGEMEIFWTERFFAIG